MREIIPHKIEVLLLMVNNKEEAIQTIQYKHQFNQMDFNDLNENSDNLLEIFLNLGNDGRIRIKTMQENVYNEIYTSNQNTLEPFNNLRRL